jgi:RNA polymerase sigma factor (sigma-70 family)
MLSQSSEMDDDSLLAERCLHGDPAALAGLRERCHRLLTETLISRGATRTEAEDLLADLWTDCVPGNPEDPSLLGKYGGKCPLQAWLATVVTRRWIDLKRRQVRHGESAGSGGQEALEQLPADAGTGRDDGMVELLREALQAAFALCPPESMVLLRLVYLHGVSQREIMRMLGCSESKVSRGLSKAMKDIELHTLEHLKSHDPYLPLTLTWQDFLDLCQTQQIGFL